VFGDATGPRPEFSGSHAGPAQRTGTATMGLVVGLRVPPAGSTVSATTSPRTTPVASTGAVRPSTGRGSSPAERTLVPATNHS